jgi:alpha-amylase/alpha-mannosidase (GH57 family)
LSALGIFQPLSSNILEFLKALPECAKQKGITFSTPSEIVTKLKSESEYDWMKHPTVDVLISCDAGSEYFNLEKVKKILES